MGKELATAMNSALALPDADYDKYFGGANIAERETVPSVTFTGKVWTVNYNGQKHKLVKKDEDGDELPLSTMKVVILDYSKDRGRAYYEGEFDPATPGRPVCWSEDGKLPHSSIAEPCAKRCDICPKSVKGSKITPQGKEVKACAEHRMIVVVPANGLGQFPPLRMKLAVTSDYDARSPELAAQGWYAFKNYMDDVRAKGIKHSAALVTKMKFDPNAAYPKILFAIDRRLEPQELAVVGPLSQSQETKALVTGSWSPNGAEGNRTALPPVDQIAEEEAPKPVKKAAPAPEPVAKVVKKAPPPPPANDEDEDDDIPFEKPAAKKAMPKSAEPVVAVTMPEGLDDLLADFEDD